MEIYKIRDFEKKEDADANAELRITDLRQAVKNENRVNVFVNNKYSFSLDISQVVDFRLKKGMVISPEQLDEYKRASEFGKLYQRTLEWVLSRPHSERETRDYLYRKFRNTHRGASATNEERVSEARPVMLAPWDANCRRQTGESERTRDEYFELSNRIISQLVSKGYVDDVKFAEYYVENRFVKKGISRKRLRTELVKKGIANDIIDSVLDARSDEEEIKKIIIKKRARYDDEKLIAYLCRQGFDYQLSKELVQSYETDLQNLE